MRNAQWAMFFPTARQLRAHGCCIYFSRPLTPVGWWNDHLVAKRQLNLVYGDSSHSTVAMPREKFPSRYTGVKTTETQAVAAATKKSLPLRTKDVGNDYDGILSHILGSRIERIE